MGLTLAPARTTAPEELGPFTLARAHEVAREVSGRVAPDGRHRRRRRRPRSSRAEGRVVAEADADADAEASAGPGSDAGPEDDARPDPRLRKPGPTLGAIARDVVEKGAVRSRSHQEEKALRRLMACRTPVLGGVRERCGKCGFAQHVFRSCGDRHCPGCGALLQERWVESQYARTLDVAHVHTVLTLPPALRPLARNNPREVYDLLLAASTAAVRELAREQLGADVGVGFTAVLHTWNSRSSYHPHAHLILASGGLAPDGRWVPAPATESLLPTDRLRARFRDRFLEGLEALRAEGALRLVGRHLAPLRHARAWEVLVEELAGGYWHGYAKETLARGEDAFAYLARYTSRIGFSNHRIRAYDRERGNVELATKHGEVFTLGAAELVRRFLLHVLPKGFHRIRHYGLLAPRATRRREQARAAIAALREEDGEAAPDGGAEADGEAAPPKSTYALYEELTGIDLTRCPCCGTRLEVRPLRPDDAPLAFARSREPT